MIKKGGSIVKKCIAKRGQTVFCRADGSAMNKDYFREYCFYPVMDALGFVINSIWLMALITFMIRMRENTVDVHAKKAVLKSVGISVLYAAILVLVASFVFSTWLKVTLP